MAVIKDQESTQEITIKISNGDFGALKKIKEDYNLKDISDVITFALGVLSQADGKSVTIERSDGSTLRLVPSDKLKKQSE